MPPPPASRKPLPRTKRICATNYWPKASNQGIHRTGPRSCLWREKRSSLQLRVFELDERCFLRRASRRLWPAGCCWPEHQPRALSQQSLSRYVNSTDAEAVITVFPAERAAYRIPRPIYGTFLEHIGESVFGGVSAQLLDNPSLEPYPATPEVINQRFSAAAFRESTQFNLPLPWLPLRPAGRRYDLRSGNAANSTSFLYLMGLAGREVGIRQSVYLPVERELRYQGVLFASAAEGAVTLSLSFRRHDRPAEVLA